LKGHAPLPTSKFNGGPLEQSNKIKNKGSKRKVKLKSTKRPDMNYAGSQQLSLRVEHFEDVEKTTISIYIKYL